MHIFSWEGVTTGQYNIIFVHNTKVYIYALKSFVEIPEPVNNLKIEGKDDIVTLSWAEPENNGAAIIRYSIYTRIARDDEWTKVADLEVKDGLKLEYILTLDRGKNYELMVTSTNEFGESDMNKENIQTVEVPKRGEQRVDLRLFQGENNWRVSNSF